MVHSNKETGNTSFFPGTEFKIALDDKSINNDPVLNFIGGIDKLMGDGSEIILITCYIGEDVGMKIADNSNLTHDFYAASLPEKYKLTLKNGTVFGNYLKFHEYHPKL